MRAVTVYEMTGEELRAMGCSCIVESWKNKAFGRGRRLWNKQFSAKEQQKAEKYYKLAYLWGFNRQHGGYPNIHRFESYDDYAFLHKLATFFATL